ncbi:3-deoxy-7-phosphoheptulonate synthase [Isachenkonia alkalipeptolytica]|uniref:3-deoxy-7-phosphoheptulonate synthase n=1 Tax=Isachenkonia alkalipeptolytica TaxID=2565777 RepID=A0AA43XIL9_9CLOT|nr:3-deoxy-7-phosphoheptulonate synthase [Isachenkonia alkalipeptolytica]NBG87437.1 3-deoxy-7-phosphoheptulonate synthase [Isachenkonia alkalipeptolytica]
MKEQSRMEKMMIAGPCSIESYGQAMETAKYLKSLGVKNFRGGAFKPRTSPDSFQGLGREALEIMKAVKKETGLITSTEVMDGKDIAAVYDAVDILQIGSRNMHNYTLLQTVGAQDKPIILKRGMSATMEEWIKASEYIRRAGNDNIIMCERGIRTFDTYTRNTMDIAAIPIIKNETGLPVIADPSHGTGRKELILPMSKAALAAGADGIMVEVHPQPERALSDGEQSLSFEEFRYFYREIKSRD